jgi:hypothetical protein
MNYSEISIHLYMTDYLTARNISHILDREIKIRFCKICNQTVTGTEYRFLL